MGKKSETKHYHALGIMSGSSLDGLDLAYCHFEIHPKKRASAFLSDWKLIQGSTLPFNAEWKERLRDLPKASALEIMQADVDFGHYTGQQVNQFLNKFSLNPDFIAFHGHTIFHDPAKRLTVQIGDGAALAAETSFPVINHFRHQDVACHGEGAPIASIADQYLLSDYDFCLNIGGISNITALLPNKVLAFDIGPANQILNALAAKRHLEYDEGGQIASSGKVDARLMEQLNQADYYHLGYPKTLDNFWGGQHLMSKIENSSISLEDQMCTAVEHITFQIARSIQILIEQENIQKPDYRLLPTGGGVFNTFLMSRLKEQLATHTNVEIIIPDSSFIAFKEAILMALMGVLRVENIPNVMSSVTGAKHDTIGGAIHQGHSKFI